MPSSSEMVHTPSSEFNLFILISTYMYVFIVDSSAFMSQRSYLEMDIGLTGEQTEQYMQKLIVLCCSAVDTLKRLIFVGSLFDSLKVRMTNTCLKRFTYTVSIFYQDIYFFLFIQAENIQH